MLNISAGLPTPLPPSTTTTAAATWKTLTFQAIWKGFCRLTFSLIHTHPHSSTLQFSSSSVMIHLTLLSWKLNYVRCALNIHRCGEGATEIWNRNRVRSYAVAIRSKVCFCRKFNNICWIQRAMGKLSLLQEQN